MLLINKEEKAKYTLLENVDIAENILNEVFFSVRLDLICIKSEFDTFKAEVCAAYAALSGAAR